LWDRVIVVVAPPLAATNRNQRTRARKPKQLTGAGARDDTIFCGPPETKSPSKSGGDGCVHECTHAKVSNKQPKHGGTDTGPISRKSLTNPIEGAHGESEKKPALLT